MKSDLFSSSRRSFAFFLLLVACGKTEAKPGAATAASGAAATPAPAAVSLLNVSYDPTRELYVEYNKAFAKHWKAKTGQDVTI